MTRPRTSSPAFDCSRQYAAACCVGAKWPLRWTAMTESHSVLGHVHDHPVAEDPGVVDEDVEAAELVDRLLHHAAGAREVGDVVAVRDGLAARGLDLLDDLLRRRCVGSVACEPAAEVVDDDLRARGRERSACERPIPRPAPVTIATFPVRSGMAGAYCLKPAGENPPAGFGRATGWSARSRRSSRRRRKRRTRSTRSPFRPEPRTHRPWRPDAPRGGRRSVDRRSAHC